MSDIDKLEQGAAEADALKIAGTDAVVLVGGLGSRLQPVVSDLPKPMAQVAGRPFLAFILDQLAFWGLRDVVLCTGHLGEAIRQCFGDSYKTLSIRYSQEDSPLGTGGALRKSLPLLRSDTVLVMNGDSYCNANLDSFYAFHRAQRAQATLLLSHEQDSRPFGTVELSTAGRVSSFAEKNPDSGAGMVNGGVYLLSRELIASIPPGRAVSLERECFPGWIDKRFFGFAYEQSFIDIGTPASYARAESFLNRQHL